MDVGLKYTGDSNNYYNFNKKIDKNFGNTNLKSGLDINAGTTTASAGVNA